MSLAQQTMLAAFDWSMDHALLYILMILVVGSIGDFYNRFLKVDRNTDSVDLMERYLNYKMWSKYGRK
jgi:hypothetical protein